MIGHHASQTAAAARGLGWLTFGLAAIAALMLVQRSAGARTSAVVTTRFARAPIAAQSRGSRAFAAAPAQSRAALSLDPATVQSRAARSLDAAAGLLATSVLADSALEHYRGSFENPGMFTPLITSALAMLAGFNGAMIPAPSAQTAFTRRGIYLAAVAVGTIGSGFHVYNIRKRPGGFNWLNLFYAAPLGAPAALSLAGALGLLAQRVRNSPHWAAPKVLGIPAERALAGITSLGLLGTVSEVGLLHFRGAFHNPFMWVPVSIPPVATWLMGRAALARTGNGHARLTRVMLGLTALVGIGGVGFHAYGISRAMGGWRNWSQNLLSGPPLPAPPSFCALALAGHSALILIEAR